MATASAPALQSRMSPASSTAPCCKDVAMQNFSLLKAPCPLAVRLSMRRCHTSTDRHVVSGARAEVAPSEEQATLNWGATVRDTSYPPSPHYTTPKKELVSPVSGLRIFSTPSPEVKEDESEVLNDSGSLLLEPELVFQQLDYVLLRSQGKIEKIVQNNMRGIDKISSRMGATQRKMEAVSGKVDKIIQSATPKVRKIRPQSVAREEMREKLKKVTNVFTDPVKEVVPEANGEEENDNRIWSVGEVFTKWFGSLVLALALGASGAPLVAPPEAAAFELSFEGPRGWLKEQKRKNSSFILAPIANSKNRMEQVRVIIDGEASLGSEKYMRAQELVKAASLDCMPYTPGSMADLQAKTGLQPCTFKLIVKNAASLLPKDDPKRLQANAELMHLIDSFVNLDILLSQELRSGEGIQTIPSAVHETQTALDSFEAGIKNVLGVTAPSS